MPEFDEPGGISDDNDDETNEFNIPSDDDIIIDDETSEDEVINALELSGVVVTTEL